jgi:hypothetical protein
MKKNLLFTAILITSIAMVSCKKENSFVRIINSTLNNAVTDTPYRHNNVNPDTPYLHSNAVLTDTPYLRVTPLYSDTPYLRQ